MRYNQLSKESVNEFLKSKNIELIGEYLGARITTQFKCLNNHYWDASPSNVLHKSGCPHCSGRAKLTKEIINDRIVGRRLELIGDFITTVKESLFKCLECEHEWNATPGNIMAGKGCRHCATYGFNTARPAVGYILVFEDFIKYGISNNLDSRLYRHKLKNGFFTIHLTKKFLIGQDAINWEESVRRVFGGNYVSRKKCPDGFTETLPSSLLEEVSKTLA
jgi:Zn finger protein HypA/HybF involved in hydrogenase expression